VSESADLLIVLLVTLSFVGSRSHAGLPRHRLLPLTRARAQAKTLYHYPGYCSRYRLVLDESGTIRQTNTAAEKLFQINTQDLIGHHLNELFSSLAGTPEQWSSRSEQALECHCLRIIELTVSQQFHQKLQEYVVILRDITEQASRGGETVPLPS